MNRQEGLFTPARRRGVEFLDDTAVDPRTRDAAIADVARSNRWLGGSRAALAEIVVAIAAARREAASDGRVITFLDVGTGAADIPRRVASAAARSGIALTTIAVDRAWTLLRSARAADGPLDHAVCADALALPFREGSVDVVACSQLLHHFEQPGAEVVLREMSRVARRAVVVSDLRRSWFAAVGFWVVSFPLRFHTITRHDGVVSVLRGFTRRELSGLIVAASGQTPSVRRRLGFRLTARWSPSGRA